MRKTVSLFLVAICAVLVASCSFSLGGADAVTTSELEKQIASLYTADDPEAEITAECDGELKAEVDATQECHLEVGEESADVRVVVTKIEDDVVDFESTPFVPADRVAETIKNSLSSQGYEVETVECADELPGELDATATCTATPADGSGTIEATVTSVEGLMVNFDFEVVS